MAGDDTEFATIDRLMTALYGSISGPPGGQDFELSRRLCHPDVRLVRTRLDEAGKPVAFSFSGEEYGPMRRRFWPACPSTKSRPGGAPSASATSPRSSPPTRPEPRPRAGR